MVGDANSWIGRSLRGGLALAALLACLTVGPAYAQSPRKRPAGPRSEPPHPADAPPRPGPPAPSAESEPADYESPHFLVHTDMPPKEARELLKQLETMLGLISKYWGRPPAGQIECFVVRDLAHWPAGRLHPDGVAKIESGAGLTLTHTMTLGNQTVAAKAVVYAVAKPGIAQHEAVHAYCGQTFGNCGPLWYAEGMAEMGQYWRPNDASVQIHPGVLRYLQTTEPQSVGQIIKTRSVADLHGDSWQNYAWRWALCHLLANNPNYAQRFRPLGLGFLTEQEVSFENTYGAMEREIVFEYLFFVGHIEQGFRADLCSWDWKKKFKPLADSTPISVKISAARGWQPSGVQVKVGNEYAYSASGEWQVGKEGASVSADGDSGGAGRLEAVLFEDYALSEPIALGSYGTFTAPSDGQLHLRCGCNWGEIGDNKGSITVKLKPAKMGDPLPKPAPVKPEGKPADKPAETKPAATKAVSRANRPGIESLRSSNTPSPPRPGPSDAD